MIKITKEKIADLIDHTLLKQTADTDDLKKICYESLEYNFASVCILPMYVHEAAALLKGSRVAVCTVIGFPMGANTSYTKLKETMNALELGASEIDMVINLPAFFNKNYKYVVDEILSIKELCKQNNALLKVIVETCLLDEQQKIKVSQLVSQAGADFIKTSTGFSTGGATIDDVLLLRKNIDANMKVKASGGIRDYATLLKMIDAGAERIGSSSGIKIINEIV